MHRAGGDGVLNKSEQPFSLPPTDSCENDAATQQHGDEVICSSWEGSNSLRYGYETISTHSVVFPVGTMLNAQCPN